jgi:transcription elongation factor Elf1
MIDMISDTPYKCPTCNLVGVVMKREPRILHMKCGRCGATWQCKEVTGN